MDFGLKEKTALVTGGSSGIGFAIAECLVREGANVIIASRDYNHLQLALKHLQRIDPTSRIEAKQINLSDEQSIRKGIQEVEKHGPIDILVNNVGGPAAGSTLGISIEDWDKGYQSLLRSVVLLCQLTVPKMMERKWGRILTITSTAAREIIPKLPVSATFRAGLTAFAKTASRDIGRQGVLINNLLPGPTNTARLQDLKTKSPEFFNSMASETSLGRIAEPEEVARVATFLCSSANTYITGTDILVDGGYTKAL